MRLAQFCGSGAVGHTTGEAMKSILDRSFKYTKSVDTDIRKTFARIRREQRQAQRESDDASRKVLSIRRSQSALA